MDLEKSYGIYVLGAMYTLEFKDKSSDKLLKDCDGYCDKTSKKIVVYNYQDDCDFHDPLFYIQKNIRHELIHAFMFESGLAENWEHKTYGQEETAVDWFAYQLPKINNALKTAGLTDCLS